MGGIRFSSALVTNQASRLCPAAMGTATSTRNVDIFEPPSQLWLLAILFFGVGDLVTTTVGLTIGSSTEANPIVAVLIERYGVLVLVPLKATTLAVLYGVWKTVPVPYPAVIPIVLAGMGLLVTVWNTSVLLAGLS